MENNLNSMIEQTIRLVNKFHLIEAEPHYYGTPLLIYVSEIHVIDMAGRYPQLNLSEIAEKLGVTRGAVWQTVKKLEQKKLLLRQRVPQNGREITLQLTELGRQAYFGFRAIIEKKDASIGAILATLDQADQARLVSILDQLEVFLDQNYAEPY